MAETTTAYWLGGRFSYKSTFHENGGYSLSRGRFRL